MKNNNLYEKRSNLFTESCHCKNLYVPKKIILYNRKCKNIFNSKNKRQIAKNFLKSGKVLVTIPAYEEHQFGAIYKVLNYFNRLVDRKNIIVFDANSKDKTGKYVRDLGFNVIIQRNIEECLNLKKMAKDFYLALPLRNGKGKTMFLAAIYLKIKYAHENIEFNLFSDADITNPYAFNHAMYHAWVASHYKKGKLLDVKAVQHNRNNQYVMNALAMLQTANPLMHQYYQILRELIWPLTGQVMRATKFIHAIPNALGYSCEMIVNFACADYINFWQMKSTQVEISKKCLDYKNNFAKEIAMMVGISTTIYAINEKIFSKGIHLINMKPKHFREVNKYLEHLENFSKNGFLATGINVISKPNELVKIRLDRLLPSVNYLIEHGYVDVEKIKKLFYI